MRTLTNGNDVLDATGLADDTWTFAPFTLDLPVSGRACWWGAFRRGDHISIELEECASAVDVRFLGRGFLPLTGAIVECGGGTVHFEVPCDGVYHVRFDGAPCRSIGFRLSVRIPARERRVLRPIGPRTRHGLAS